MGEMNEWRGRGSESAYDHTFILSCALYSPLTIPPTAIQFEQSGAIPASWARHLSKTRATMADATQSAVLRSSPRSRNRSSAGEPPSPF